MALGVTDQGSAVAVGSSLTVEQVQRILIQPLQAASIFLASGVRIFDTNGSPIRLPKAPDPTDLSLGFVAENSSIPEDDFEFSEITLLPSTMRSIKVLTRFSNELARQSVVSLDQAIQQRLVTDVAARIDRALISSEVTDGTVPLGLLHYPDVQVMSSIGAITVDDLHDAVGLALAANVDVASLRWWLRPETFTAISKLKDGQQNYLLQPDVSQAGAMRLLGHSVTVTKRIPAWGDTTQAVLFDPSQVAVARDMAPSVRVLTERYADFDQQAIRVVCRYDAAPLNAEAIVRLDGLDVTTGSSGGGSA